MSYLDGFSNGLFLSFVTGIPLYAYLRKVPVYDAFMDGAKEGFQLIIKLIPYFVAMIVALSMFRASGALEVFTHAISPVLTWLGMPQDIVPLAVIRPFSGSTANSITAEIIQTHGGNAYVSHLAATIMGSTETTFYVVAIYFGAIGIRYTRHAVPAGLFADLIGVLASLWICRIVFGQ